MALAVNKFKQRMVESKEHWENERELENLKKKYLK